MHWFSKFLARWKFPFPPTRRAFFSRGTYKQVVRDSTGKYGQAPAGAAAKAKPTRSRKVRHRFVSCIFEVVPEELGPPRMCVLVATCLMHAWIWLRWCVS